MSRISSFILKSIHGNGFLADLVYGTAQHTWKIKSWFSHTAANLTKISPEELRPYRGLSAASAVQTAVTNICNAKCVFCAYPQAVESGALQRGVMSFEVFKQAVDEWASLHGENLDLTPTVGDTLVDPGLIQKIEYAVHTAKIKNVMLTTNAILLNRNNLYQRLVDSGLKSIFISTHGTGRELYKQVYGVDHYDDVMSGLKNLFEYNRAQGCPVFIGIRFRNAQKPSEILNSEDFAKFIKPYLGDQVAVNFTVDYDNWGGAITEQDMLGHMRLRTLPLKVDAPCTGLFGFVVRHDGQVRLCGCRFKKSDTDDMIVGDLGKETLKQISEGERTWKIIEGFYSGQRPETCVGCTMYRPIDRQWLKQRMAKTTSNGQSANGG